MRNKSIFRMILISFALALLATISLYLYLNTLQKPVKETANKTKIYVAAQTIPARTLIESSMLTELQIDESALLADYLKDSTQIAGKYSKETIYQNEGFIAEKLIDKNGDELSLKIENNHRAMTINATGDSGVAQLIRPGDFVDVVGFAAEKKDGVKTVRDDTAKIILQNVEVLAIDKSLNREIQEADTDKKNENTQVSFLVTLSIPTLETETLVLAESIGSVKLALRPIKEDGKISTDGTSWQELYKPANGGSTTTSPAIRN